MWAGQLQHTHMHSASTATEDALHAHTHPPHLQAVLPQLVIALARGALQVRDAQRHRLLQVPAKLEPHGLAAAAHPRSKKSAACNQLCMSDLQTHFCAPFRPPHQMAATSCT